MFRSNTATARTVLAPFVYILVLSVLAAPAVAEDVKLNTTPGKFLHASKSFELNDAKAGTLFNLLAPDHVRIVVRRTASGVGVDGTAREVDTLAAFVKILTRDEGKDYNADAAALAELRKRWDTEKTYKMRQPVADALFAVLAFNDVPIFVAHTDKGLTVQATQADQKIIRRVVLIARGDQPKDAKPKKHAAKKRAAKKVEAKPGQSRKAKTEAKIGKQQDTKRPKGRPAEKRGAKDGKRRGRGSPGDRNLAKRLDKLAERVAELEELVAGMDRGERGAHHGFAHHDAPRGHGRHEHHGHRGDTHRGKSSEHGKHKTEGKRGAHERHGRGGERQLIDRRYRLPKHHAEHLFALFAPADITDVIISREGNQLRIRATESDHKTIERLVNLLKRGDGKKSTRRSKVRAGAAR